MKKIDEKRIILLLLLLLVIILAFGKARADDFGVGSANVSGYVYEWGGGGPFNVPMTYSQTFTRGSYPILYNIGVYNLTNGSYSLNYSNDYWVGVNIGNENQSLTFLLYPNNTNYIPQGGEALISAYGYFTDCGSNYTHTADNVIDLSDEKWQEFMQAYNYTQDSAPPVSELVGNFAEFSVESMGCGATAVIGLGNFLIDLHDNNPKYQLAVGDFINDAKMFFGAVGQGNYVQAFSGSATNYHSYMFTDEVVYTHGSGNAVSCGFTAHVPTGASSKISARRVCGVNYSVKVSSAAITIDDKLDNLAAAYGNGVGGIGLYDVSGNEIPLNFTLPQSLTIHANNMDDLIDLIIEVYSDTSEIETLLIRLFTPSYTDIDDLNSTLQYDLGILYMPFDFVYSMCDFFSSQGHSEYMSYKIPTITVMGHTLYEGSTHTFNIDDICPNIQIGGQSYEGGMIFRYLATWGILLSCAWGTFNHIFNDDEGGIIA